MLLSFHIRTLRRRAGTRLAATLTFNRQVMPMTSRFLVLPTLAVLALASALACAGGDAVAPVRPLPPSVASASSEEIEHSGQDGARPKPVACARHAPVVGSGRFGPSGGTLVVGNSRLFIPGGALADTVTITGTVLGDATSTISFQPEGLRFRKPVGLALSGADCSLPPTGEASIVYLGNDGQVRETIEAIYLPRWKLVAAPIVHFSGYAIAF